MESVDLLCCRGELSDAFSVVDRCGGGCFCVVYAGNSCSGTCGRCAWRAADLNSVTGTVRVGGGVVLRNGSSSVHQTFGKPEIKRAVPSTVEGGDYFQIEGMGPVVDAQWRIYAPGEDGVKATDYWVDAHLTTTIFGDVSATCEILSGKPGSSTSVPARVSGFACSWRDLQLMGGDHQNNFKPTLDVGVASGIREVTDRGEQDRILDEHCADKDHCRFVPESFSDKVIGPEELVGTPVRNTTSFMTTPQYGWTHRIGWSDAIGAKATAKATIGIVEASLEGNYTHTWGQDKTFSEVVPLPIAPHSIGYVTHQATLVNVTGYFLVDMGGSTVKVPGRVFDGPRVQPDPGDPQYGNWVQGRVNLYNCPLDHWNDDRGVCDQPPMLTSTLESW